MKIAMISSAALTLLLLVSGCGEDCRTIPCDCPRSTAELYRTEHVVSDTIEARQAFVIYQAAVAEDPQLLPEALKIEGAFGLGYISASRGFKDNGVQYWKVLVSYHVLEATGTGWFHELYVSHDGVMVESLLCL